MVNACTLLGSTGAVGSAVHRQLLDAGYTVHAPRIDPFARYADLCTALPDAPLINCLAMTGIDRCLAQREAALTINGGFPQQLAHWAEDRRQRVLHLSTEAVFSCMDPHAPYSIADAPCPATWYGRTKHLGERVANEWFSVVRLPLVFGGKKQIVHQLVERALRKEQTLVATDVYSTPVCVEDVAAWIAAWVDDDSDPLVHVTGDTRMSLYRLVRSICSELDCQQYLTPVQADYFGKNKPRYGGLASPIQFDLNAAIQRYAHTLC